jgi:anti-sigma factor RsiW
VRQAVGDGGSGARRPWLRGAAAGALGGAALAALIAVPLARRAAPAGGGGDGDGTAREIVTAHLRSLQADHLLDVASSDRHTVKPWFQGRLDFTVTPTDLAAQGFVLAGGRVDYVAGVPTAAIVYRKQLHVMNVLCWPAAAAPPVRDASLRGFSIAAFSRGDVSCAVVADAATAEVQRLRDLLRAAPP